MTYIDVLKTNQALIDVLGEGTLISFGLSGSTSKNPISRH